MAGLQHRFVLGFFKMKTITLEIVQTAAAFGEARRLFEEYESETKADACFQGFSEELRNLDRLYQPPEGALFLASFDGLPVGCVAIRRLNEKTCEIKRLYVRSADRGLHVGRQLVMAAINKAVESGFLTMTLTTLPTMQVAQTLYRAMGFVETDRAESNNSGIMRLERRLYQQG
jgi:putative acetyltransferase